jgi:PKD repeat protein
MKSIWRVFGIICIFALCITLAPPVMASVTEAKTGYIIVGLAPVADFDAAYAYNIVPTTVRFTDRSSGSTPLTYLWDFGDGATSTDTSPSHVYTKRGTYTVKLTVKNLYGSSTETKVNIISIGVSPVADFSADTMTGNVPLSIKFTDRTIGQPTKWSWNFGDGQGSAQQNPVHTYWAGGQYTVTLTASNEFGSSDAFKTSYIIAIPALKSRFSADPMTGKAPLTVKFTDRSFGNPTAWKWDFGDGTTSTQTNPVHTFTSGGAFDVVLDIDREGLGDSSVQVIDVGGVPVTDFVADKTVANTEEKIRFTDKTSNSPVSWKWDFGDGSESSVQNPVKTYPAKGIFTVSLFTKNENGKDTEVKVNYINIGAGPKADFIAAIPEYQKMSSRQVVRFIDRSIGYPTVWVWNFGDGQTSTEQNPIHVYEKDGIYTVSLTAKNTFGENTKVASNLITVGFGPKVDFTADNTRVGVLRNIRFTDLSTNSPSAWVWEFGDGTTGTGKNPDHSYRATGVYDVTLTVSNQYTSTSQTKKQYITVINIPRTDFVADRIKGTAPFEVHFTDLSDGDPTSWKWDLGDGWTTSDRNPAHTYTAPGTYTISLTATNANGQDTVTKNNYIVVTAGPVANFKVDQRIGKAPFIVKFRDLSTGNPTKWDWDFGDGTTSTEQNPQHVYQNEGAYDVRLTVSNQYGSDTSFKTGTTGEGAILPAGASTMVPATTPEVKGPVTTAKTTATQAPVSLSPVIGALVVGILTTVAMKRR